MATEDSPTELTTFETKDLAKSLERRYKATSSSRINASGGRFVLDSLAKIAEGQHRGVIDVQLAVPREIAKGIRARKLVRSGSVVRKSGNKQYVKFLNEIKPAHAKKLKKAALLPLLVLDAAEKALLDQKLIKIQELLEGVDRKIDAQIEGQLAAALQYVKDAAMAGTPERRRGKLEDAQRELRRAEKVYESLYRAKWEKDFPDLKRRYMKAKIGNGSERRRLAELASEMAETLQIIVACRQTHLQLTHDMGDAIGAENEAADLEVFLLEEETRFSKAFGPNTFLHMKIYQKSLGRRFGGDGKFARDATKAELRLPLEEIAFLRNTVICHHLSLPIPEAIEVNRDGK